MSASSRALQQILEETQWLQELPFQLRDRISSESYEAFYKKDELVARRGEASTSWIGVADGLLKISAVYRTGRIVMFSGIPAGSWVGEGSVLKREVRRYDIIALRDSRVIHLPGATFRWLLDVSIEFNHMMIARLNERLAQYIGMVEIDRLTDPVARVARSIGSLYNPVLFPTMGPLLGLSQAEIGELSGLSRQSVSTALKQLQAEGLIKVGYGGIIIRNLSALIGYQERLGRQGEHT